jgi:hypothetical protein
MIAQKQLTEVINTAYDAVEASKFGKLLTGERDPNGHIVYNSISLQVFMNILVNTLGHTLKENETKKDK